jgi:hypothetical protein
MPGISFSSTNLNKGSGNDSHHVVKETTASNFNDDSTGLR